LACYIPRWYTRPKAVTHPSTNRVRRALTSFLRQTPLTTTPRRQPNCSNRTISVKLFISVDYSSCFSICDWESTLILYAFATTRADRRKCCQLSSIGVRRQLITLSVHLCVQHGGHGADSRAGQFTAGWQLKTCLSRIACIA